MENVPVKCGSGEGTWHLAKVLAGPFPIGGGVRGEGEWVLPALMLNLGGTPKNSQKKLNAPGFFSETCKTQGKKIKTPHPFTHDKKNDIFLAILDCRCIKGTSP